VRTIAARSSRATTYFSHTASANLFSTKSPKCQGKMSCNVRQNENKNTLYPRGGYIPGR